jgi:putative FmdB family regulatory protein
MPVYARRCQACNLKFDAFATMAQSTFIRCQQCGGPTSVDWSDAKPPAVVKESYHGRDSIMWERACKPAEVEECRKLYEGTGIDINDKGEFSAPDKSAARKFYKREASLKKQFAEEKAET